MNFLANLLLLSTAWSVLGRSAEGAKRWVNPNDWFNDRLRREVVDLHNGEFCVDVSTYGLVSFEKVPREKCDTKMDKVCESKSKQVCDEVTEIQCEIIPFTDCEMQMEPGTFKTFKMVSKVFKKKICSEGSEIIQHTKMMPQCKNVTKQNCVTKWETDANGNQVWAGNEDCEPVTWKECNLVPQQVDFKVPKIVCDDAEEIPYMDCEDSEKEQMITKMTCEVKHATNCKPVVSTKCQSISYQECEEKPKEECKSEEMMVPTQEKEHKKKCLLPDDATAGSPAARARGNNNSTAVPATSTSSPDDTDAEVAAVLAEINEDALQESESRQHFRQAVPAQQPRSAKQQGRFFQGQVSAPKVHHDQVNHHHHHQQQQPQPHHHQQQQQHQG